MPQPLVVHRRVEFSDTDMAGIVHFATYFRYMEAAEHDFWRSLGLSVVMHDGDMPISWPRVAASCDYLAPAMFGDELEIDAAIERLGERSVTYQFTVRREDARLAVGKMTSVCCRMTPGEPPQSIPIPAHVRTLLEAASAD